ncbi:hypothetical protein ABXK36_36985, partial [Bacillus cereus]|uniref:hypothetical protein n=1 Tax=Bacillus cereus TaxID=1396 RepID=UPI0035F76EAD
ISFGRERLKKTILVSFRCADFDNLWWNLKNPVMMSKKDSSRLSFLILTKTLEKLQKAGI